MILLPAGSLYSQNDDFTHIRLFQSYFTDARVSESAYISGLFSALEAGTDILAFDTRGGAVITPEIEVETRIAALFIEPGLAGGRNGVSDWLLTGRYLFDMETIHLAAGSQFTLPVGSESVGAGNFNYGFYTASRYELTNWLMLTGNVNLNFIKIPFLTRIGDFFAFDESRETVFGAGTGAIVDVGGNVFLLSEFIFQTKTDFSLFSAGLDYFINRRGHIRLNIFAGLDNGAPDSGISFGLIIPF